MELNHLLPRYQRGILTGELTAHLFFDTILGPSTGSLTITLSAFSVASIICYAVYTPADTASDKPNAS